MFDDRINQITSGNQFARSTWLSDWSKNTGKKKTKKIEKTTCQYKNHSANLPFGSFSFTVDQTTWHGIWIATHKWIIFHHSVLFTSTYLPFVFVLLLLLLLLLLLVESFTFTLNSHPFTFTGHLHGALYFGCLYGAVTFQAFLLLTVESVAFGLHAAITFLYVQSLTLSFTVTLFTVLLFTFTFDLLFTVGCSGRHLLAVLNSCGGLLLVMVLLLLLLL
jgi:hypothetical protein